MEKSTISSVITPKTNCSSLRHTSMMNKNQFLISLSRFSLVVWKMVTNQTIMTTCHHIIFLKRKQLKCVNFSIKCQGLTSCTDSDSQTPIITLKWEICYTKRHLIKLSSFIFMELNTIGKFKASSSNYIIKLVFMFLVVWSITLVKLLSKLKLNKQW